MDVVTNRDAGQHEAPKETILAKPIYSFHVSADSMVVEMELPGDGANTLPPVYEDMIAELGRLNVKFGIETAFLQDFCKHPVFGRKFIVAKGKPAETGADGYLNYLVETERSLRPKERADGTVDYYDLGYTQNVLKGQPVCEIHGPKMGASGMDVYGKLLPGAFGKAPPSPAGKNTELSADGMTLLASCDGSVSVTRGIASIIDRLQINGDVDASTGNVDFVGDIAIKGGVISGFRVTAKGNIVISGSVEGARIEAAGDITINGGINGMDSCELTAGGSVKCRYIQSASVKAGGDIYADVIMHSNVVCGGNVEIAGQRGRLIGGRATVAGYLKATTIGTDSHVPTVVVMDCSGDIDKDIQALAEKIGEMDKEEVKLRQLFSRIAEIKQKGRMTPDILTTMESAAASFKQLQLDREEAKQALEEAKAEQLRLQTQAADSYIICKERIHTGVTLQFGPISLRLNQSVVGVRAMLIDGEIRFIT